MKKSELESGMWVKTREGKEYLVIKNSKWEALVNKSGFHWLDNYNEGLVMTPDSSGNDYAIFDIMSVFISDPRFCYGYGGLSGNLIWERT